MMRKPVFCAALLAAATLFAGVPSSIKFSTTGPDLYADGTQVLDGEVYALVWVKSGSEFAGLNADGTLVNAVDNKIVARASIAKDGRCPTVIYMISGEKSCLAASGTFEVYLFDTRRTSATGAVAVGKSGDGSEAYANVAFNGYVKVDAVVTTASGADVSAPVSLAGGSVTTVPEGFAQPSISRFYMDGDQAVLEVANTVPYINYTVSGGATPADVNKEIASGVNGGEGTIVLTTDMDDEDAKNFRFFKVVRTGSAN